MEKALTAGGSLTQIFTLVKEEDATLSFDYFRTQFYNSVIADQEYSPNDIYIYRLGQTLLYRYLSGRFFVDSGGAVRYFRYVPLYEQPYDDRSSGRQYGARGASAGKPLQGAAQLAVFDPLQPLGVR